MALILHLALWIKAPTHTNDSRRKLWAGTRPFVLSRKWMCVFRECERFVWVTSTNRLQIPLRLGYWENRNDVSHMWWMFPKFSGLSSSVATANMVVNCYTIKSKRIRKIFWEISVFWPYCRNHSLVTKTGWVPQKKEVIQNDDRTLAWTPAFCRKTASSFDWQRFYAIKKLLTLKLFELSPITDFVIVVERQTAATYFLVFAWRNC